MNLFALVDIIAGSKHSNVGSKEKRLRERELHDEQIIRGKFAFTEIESQRMNGSIRDTFHIFIDLVGSATATTVSCNSNKIPKHKTTNE